MGRSLGPTASRRYGQSRKDRQVDMKPRALPAAESGEPGFIYFAQAGIDGPIKISWSKIPHERLSALQTASPFELAVLALLEGTKEDERRLHERFAGYRLKGEWFRDCAAIRSALSEQAQAIRRPSTNGGERCLNCRALLVQGEGVLCKACVEFMDDWATPEFKKMWAQRAAVIA
jgi:Meiotically up-regulated gene 113